MATKKKMLQAAAGNATGGAGLDITDVFSTYLYESAGTSSQGNLIQNGVDLTEEGSLIWTKSRGASRDNYLVSRESSSSSVKSLISNSTSSASSGSYFAYQSNGYNLPTFPDSATGTASTTSGEDFVSWTFRKAPKFFTCLTYTGTGPGSAANEQQVSHDLGAKPGIVIIKRTNATGDWWVFTDVIDGSNDYGYLNQTAAFGATGNNVATDSVFSVGGVLNTSGATYVAYLFANNNGDGEFGPDGDQDIIKCGSVTSNSNGQIPFEDLGFEPQWIITKRTDGTSDWIIHDVMRGWGYNTASANSVAEALRANTSGAESGGSTAYSITPTGFYSNANFGANRSFIYIAIRRGPLSPPESGTEVFDVDTSGVASPWFDSGFPVDMAFWRQLTADNTQISSRMTGTGRLYTNLTSSEGSGSAFKWDYMDGWYDGGINSSYSWMWKRAPGFCDIVAYTGDSPGGVGVQTVSHNLGVAPEMIWYKRRDGTGGWGVLVTALGTAESGGIEYGQGAYLNETSAFAASGWWGSPYVAPTATEFTVRGSTPNASGGDYIAYLFASLDGISKVGSFTIFSGQSSVVDCGFSSGARFVLIKRTDGSDYWWVFDTERGITVSSSPGLRLDATNAESSDTYLTPNSSGFATVAGYFAAGDYIFYAIA